MRAVAALLLLATAGTPAGPPEVTVAQGRLAGTLDGGVAAFKGIPYAAPPVGALRWRAPQAAPGWDGVRDASAFGPVCPQHATTGLAARTPLPQSEDCLTLNVWSPDLHPARPQAVMVWIHGGGLAQGGSALPFYDGAALARRGVVVVSFNYRLGRLGFFALPALEAEHPGEPSGNYGLLDQIAALRWVRDNIAAFGGDSADVTVFGESAGGVSVDALMTSPLARGLFERAISESGPALFGTVTLADAEAASLAFAARLGASGPGALAALRAARPESILADGADILEPIVDGRVLTEDVASAFARGDIAPVPYLTGTNSDEGSLLRGAAPAWLTARLGTALDSVRALYDRAGTLDDAAFARALFNDQYFAATSALLALGVTRAGPGAWVYRFRFLPAILRARRAPGVPHGGEIPFVFGFGALTAYAPARDLAVKDMVQAYWTNFAKTGDPNGAGLPAWPRYDGAAPPTLVIDDTTAAVPDFRKAETDVALRLWSRRAGLPVP